MLSRRRLLGGGLAASALGASAARGAMVSGGKKLIIVFARGGWDPTYHFDPKLDSPHVDGPEVDPRSGDPDDVEGVEVIEGHPVAVNDGLRPNVRTFFEAWGHRCIAVTGVAAGGIAHPSNRRRLLSGRSGLDGADLGALLGRQSDVTQPLGAVDLSGWGHHGDYGATLTRAGSRWQLGRLLAQPNSVEGYPGAPVVPAEDAMVARYLRRRAVQHEAVPGGQAWAAALDASLERLGYLRANREAISQLFARDPTSTLANMDLAVDLVSGGWARSVLVDTQLFFDTHGHNDDQTPLTDALYEGLLRLMDGLWAAGTLDDTLVVVVSEMVRSPRRNAAQGKDHWPLMAYLVLGAGIVGGRRIGGTDDHLTPVPIDLATGERFSDGEVPRYDQVLAGLMAHLDLDPGESFPGLTPLGGWSG